MTTAFIGIGSNVGDRLGNLARAVDRIAGLDRTHVEEISHAYESAPAYYDEQDNFVNAVVEITTGLEPESLLGYLHDIENEMGRVRNIDNGPRVIDLDLLLYGDEQIENETLAVPHPGITERDFVLTPLLEIAPRTKLPDGTPLRRADATVGAVFRDLGRVPDAGAEHNMPITATEWVVVAESEWAHDVVAGWDSMLRLKREVLEQDGIPYAFEPHEPGLDMDPFGLQTTFRLLVPTEYAEQAGSLLEAVEDAEPQYEDIPE